MTDKEMYADKIINLLRQYVILHGSLTPDQAADLGNAVDVLEADKSKSDP